MAEPLRVVISDEDETVHVDPVTGTVVTDQPDGGKVVQLDARKSSDGADGDDKWFANLADDLNQMELAKIANELIEAIDADDKSRLGYLANRVTGLKLMGIKLDEPQGSVADTSAALDGMSTVTNPLLLEAVLKGWANARAELLPAEGPVKISDEGDETAQEDELAERLERDMNHWFTTTASEYYPDTSHMLLWGTYFGGSGFKKVYRCPMRRRPVSESVDAKDLIVSDTTKDLRSCARITHQISMRPSVMKRMQLIGAYRDVTLTQPSPELNQVDQQIAATQGTSPQKSRPEDQEYTIWETQCELDIDKFATGKFKGEGIPLPYLVTIDKDSRAILALRRDWSEDDENCERKRMYVKYPYVPGPGFYGTGLLNILGNSSAAMTIAWREALDAGQFASFPGGLADKAATRQDTSDIRVGPGQFRGIETGGRDIRTLAMPMPYKDVTPGLINMMDRITQQAKEVGGVADIPSSEGVQNVPVGTMLAQIEQATKVIAAAHKDQHGAQALEFEMIFDLFRENPEDFWRSNKIAPKDYWNEQKFLQALNDTNLVPKSDPNVPSHIHRIAKALGLVQLFNVPAFAPFLNPKEALLRCLRAMREDQNGLVVDPPPQPPMQGDPANMLKAQAAMLTAQTGQTNAQIKAAQVGQDSQNKQAELAVEQNIADTNLKKELVIHASDTAREQQTMVHDQAMDRAQHGLDVAEHLHQRNMDHAGLQQQRDQLAHDSEVAGAQHALDVHTALNPPESNSSSQ